MNVMVFFSIDGVIIDIIYENQIKCLELYILNFLQKVIWICYWLVVFYVFFYKFDIEGIEIFNFFFVF